MTTGVERFGKFVVLRPIRKGGMGALSLAFDTEGRRIVVLKRLRPLEPSSEAARRFRDEAKLALTLSHPNLVRCIEAGVAGEAEYLALGWIVGQDLDALSERARRFDEPIPLPVAGAIVLQMCDALEYAHAQNGFVHRDVSPSNIVVSYQGVAHLLDYGIALSRERSSKTLPGMAPGTAGFVAPEQRNGRPADVRTDLFALASVFHFLFTGLPAFGDGEDGGSLDALSRRLAAYRGLPAPLVAVMWRTLQRNPDDRYRSAAELADALRRVLGEIAQPEAVGRFIGGLFPVERKDQEGELEGWRAQFGLPVASAAPVLQGPPVAQGPSDTERPRGTERPRDRKRPRDTFVIQRETAPRPALRRWAGAASVAVSIVAVSVVGALAWRTFGRIPAKAAGPRRAIAAAPSLPSSPEVPPSAPSPAAAPGPLAPVPSAPVSPVPSASVSPPSAANSKRTVAAPVSPVKRIAEAKELQRVGHTNLARRLLAQLGRDPRAKVALAELELEQGNQAQATRLASEAARLGGGASALYVRACARLSAGKLDAAVADFRRVLAMDGAHAEAREGLARAENQLRRRSP